MAKRIPQLDPTTSAGSDDLLELAQVNNLSPTGFVSRRIRVGDLISDGGGGSLPFRFPFEGEAEFSSPDYAEINIEFLYEDLHPYAALANENEECYKLLNVSMKIQFSSVMFYTVDGPDGTIGTSTDASVQYSNEGGYAFLFHTDTTPNYSLPMSYLSHYSPVPQVFPSEVWTEEDEYPNGKVVLKLKVAQGYNNWLSLNRMRFKGYADITASFGQSENPPE